MQFIDSWNLPAPIKAAIAWQSTAHNPDSDISCTGLIDAPLLRWLAKWYYHMLRDEYVNGIFRLNGTLMHLVLEKFGGAENAGRVEKDVMAIVNGWRVSAKVDYVLEGDSLIDYKYTSAWAIASGIKPEWERQLNVGLWLMRHDEDWDTREVGLSIKRLFICAILKDYGPKIQRETNFNGQQQFPCPVVMLPVKVWNDDFATKYIEERVALHQSAMKNMNVIPPICSDQERWLKNFAVMKTGRKNAMKAKIKTREEAEEWMEQLGGNYIREAESIRCSMYCIYGSKLNQVCPYWDAENQCVRDKPMVSTVNEDPDHKRKSGD